jgi:hypothetical protein
VAPDAYVVDVDPDRNVLLLHRADGHRSALEREVAP